jgi:allophanate hydrolase
MSEWPEDSGNLDFCALRAFYKKGALGPTDVARAVLARIARRGEDGVWIFREPGENILARARELESVAGEMSTEALFARYPLYGLPFAIKDNIDWAGRPTTAACPEYAYTPESTAPAVERLLDAGAFLVGKTNLDQFATGLVGVRSPYGVPRNPFDERYIPGGSSSGSAVAVSAGLVSFALGTDTAGSGRVPAGFNNIVGLKPTRGIVSTSGVVPACRSLDCVAVFALTVSDAAEALGPMAEEDGTDPFSRPVPPDWEAGLSSGPLRGLRVGVPREDQREFFGDGEAEVLFGEAIQKFSGGGDGVEVAEIDFSPFRRAAEMLYGGPWVAERYAAIRVFFDARPEALHPATREIIGGGKKYTAADVFEAAAALEGLRKEAGKAWEGMDVLMTPTAGTVYTLAQVEADPFALNTNLGYYTNFMNLLDLCGLAVPSGFYAGGLPAGVTFIAPAFREKTLAALGTYFHQKSGLRLGATSHPVPGGPVPAESS